MNLTQDEIEKMMALANADNSSEESAEGAEEAEAPATEAAEAPAGIQAMPGNSFESIANDEMVPDPDFNSADYQLTTDEIDILGEMGNMCMGKVATTMYSLLDRPCSITTPSVSVHTTREVLSVYKVPFVMAEVEYVKGIEGKNLLLLKEYDAALITDLLMGGDGHVEEPIELNELHMSAVSEVMNQMIGASATSLSKIIDAAVDISTPYCERIDTTANIGDRLDQSEVLVKISFDMEIEGLLKSQLLQLMPFELARSMAKRMMDVMMGEVSEAPASDAFAAQPEAIDPAMIQGPSSQQYSEDVAAYLTHDGQFGAQQAAPQQQQQPPPPPQQPPQQQYAPPPEQQQQYQQQPQQQPQQQYQQQPQQQYQQQPQQQYQQQPQQQYQQQPQQYQQQPQQYQQQTQYQQPQQYQTQPIQQQAPVDIRAADFVSFDDAQNMTTNNPLGMLHDIPLQVSVELGKTNKSISEILEFTTGTVIVLDKTAGEPVDVMANGKLIARGEVVVIDENYGVRITEIINR
ncbi:MAG: flagellar motor switch phosphatase FliY [Oscillospiraceae bacterium]|jgi:flagellar motor switch protein FliN/FliY|nr:flagellar motor switch phosphatase FliY [Oscillospiraceae bacterium]